MILSLSLCLSLLCPLTPSDAIHSPFRKALFPSPTFNVTNREESVIVA